MSTPKMRLEFVQPFVDGAFTVLREAMHANPRRGSLSLRTGNTFTSQELTAMIGVNGDVEGVALYGLSLIAAQRMAGKLMGAPVTEFDEVTSSAIAELANMITGNATTELERAGFSCDITPPSLIWGMGSRITTAVPALIVPVITELGDMEINLALAPARVVAARPVIAQRSVA